MDEFEYDESKSIANLNKHGIDFDIAQQLWLDPNAVQVQAKCEDELRYLVIARISGKHWSAITTQRGSAIRIISVRRARKKEVELYES